MFNLLHKSKTFHPCHVLIRVTVRFKLVKILNKKIYVNLNFYIKIQEKLQLSEKIAHYILQQNYLHSKSDIKRFTKL